MLILTAFQDPISFVAIIASLIMAFSVHEYFHAFSAYQLGDDTAKRSGRLTLNPLVHIDPIGFIFLMLVGFGWAKPTPVNPFNFSNHRWGSLYVAVSGPMSNFGMALVGSLILWLDIFSGSEFVVLFLYYFIYINILLGVFNLLPFAPLDGFHIFASLFRPEKYGHSAFLFLSNPFMVIIAVFLMIYIVSPLIVRPIVDLLTFGILA